MIDKYVILKQAAQFRERLGEDQASPLNIFRLAQTLSNLTIVLYPMSSNISGMCVKCGNNVVIAVNSTMTIGRQNFTLAHELYHAYYDDTDTSICSFAVGSNDVERAADQFASFLLVPPIAIAQVAGKYRNKHGTVDIAGVVALEQLYGVSRKAMLVCLQEEGILSRAEAEAMERNVIASASALGYDTDLYRPLPENKQYMSYGVYIQNANYLLDNEKLSDGKYEELLLNAFRSDIVYGVEEVEVLD